MENVFRLVEASVLGYGVKYKSLVGYICRSHQATDGGARVHFSVLPDISFSNLSTCLSSMDSLKEALIELKGICKYGGYEIRSEGGSIVVAIALRPYVFPRLPLADLQKCLFAHQKVWRRRAKWELRRRCKECLL